MNEILRTALDPLSWGQSSQSLGLSPLI